MIVRPKLNVIIPLYNAEKYIERCLLSIVNQTYENISVIVIDDGSTDRSADIVEKIAKGNKKVQLLRQANSGVSKARNTGLSIVDSGEYVTFIDSDDYMDEDSYRILMEHMVRENAQGVIFPFCRELADKKEITLLPWNDGTILDNTRIRSELIPKMIAEVVGKDTISGSVCRSIFSYDAIEHIKFCENIHIQEDLIFCIEAYSKLKDILVDNNVVYHYVKHGVTTTEKYRAKFLQESLDLEEKIIESLKKASVFEKVTEQYWNKRITMYSLCVSNLFRYDAPYEAKYEIDGIIESFAKDPYIGKKIYWKYFERRMILPYVLLKIKAKFLLSAIYSRKEKIRQKKLSL